MSGVIGFSQAGDASQPSPSIWADCPNTLLRDKGLGFFNHAEFLGGPITSAATSATATDPGLSIDCDTNTAIAKVTGRTGGVTDFEVANTDNNAVALFSQVLGKIVKNSGNKIWAEARVEVGAIADQGFFFGLAEEAALSRDVIADNIASNGVITESLFGFLVDNGDTNGVDIVYRKDAGTVVNVLNDSTNATAIPSAERASLVADTPVKLGLRFDGRDKLHFYVNGYNVCNVTVDSTIDQSKDLGVIVCLKTGTAAVQSFAIDWLRYAFKART